MAEELHSGRIKVSSDAAAAEYREAGEAVEAELSALLDEVEVEDDAGSSRNRSNCPPIEPDAIAAELGLADAVPADFGRLRRVSR